MLARASVIRNPEAPYPREGWANVTREGQIYVHAKRIGEPREWLYVLGHCVLHLGFGHFQQRFQQREWDLACECIVWQFLFTLKLGEPPEFLRGLPKLGDPELPARTEEGLFRHFCDNGIPANLPSYSLTGTPFTDMVEPTEHRASLLYAGRKRQNWEDTFGRGLAQAVTQAVEFAGGTKRKSDGSRVALTPAERARRWFVSSYPLLGALAAAFEIIEDVALCGRMQISVAAVSDYGKEIYINPGAGLSEAECRFVIAHELLHVSLRHSTRCSGRDPVTVHTVHRLWNHANSGRWVHGVFRHERRARSEVGIGYSPV